MYIYVCIQVRKNSVSKRCEVIGGPKQRFIVKELYVGDASLQRCGPSNYI